MKAVEVKVYEVTIQLSWLNLSDLISTLSIAGEVVPTKMGGNEG